MPSITQSKIVVFQAKGESGKRPAGRAFQFNVGVTAKRAQFVAIKDAHNKTFKII